MSPTNTSSYRCLVPIFALCALMAGGPVAAARAQPAHQRTPGVSGMPRGIPLFCANPTIVSVGHGAWSNPRTWSINRVPGANDKVSIGTGHRVTYDVVTEAMLACVEVHGQLVFVSDANTRMKVGTLMVLEDGVLEIRDSSQADRTARYGRACYRGLSHRHRDRSGPGGYRTCRAGGGDDARHT